MLKLAKLSLAALLLCTLQAVFAGVIGDVNDGEINLKDLLGNITTLAAKCNLRSGCYQGRQYYFEIVTQRTRDDAARFCSALNMELVNVEDCEENTFITNLLKSQPNCAKYNYWISAHQNGNRKWIWGNGSPLTYTNWKLYEPNYKKNEYCVHYRDGYLQWNDNVCSEKFYFICESNNAC